MKSVFICPVCGKELERLDKAYRCPANHSFDIARQGYVNLLLGSKSSLSRHGDDKLMVRCRRDFLEKGYYSALKDAICSAAVRNTQDGATVIDAGCGEGYYTSAVKAALEATGKKPLAAGIDISKEAVISASSRKDGCSYAVAGVFNMPFADGSAGTVLNIFSPLAREEYLRVLCKGGCLIRAVPLENHLMGLKRAVYDVPYANPHEELALDGFEISHTEIIKRLLVLDNGEDIRNLFMMTPYYYKTGREDQAKLNNISHLETELEFAVTEYIKK